MSYSTHSGQDEEIYELRSALDHHNYLIHQYSEETGLNLSSYILEKDGFWAIDLDRIVESTGTTDTRYKFYKYRDAIKHDCLYWANQAIESLREKCIARGKFLPKFQQLWNNLKIHDEGIEIHYGLSYVTLTIPIEVIVKYQIYFGTPNILSGYSQYFDNDVGKLYFDFDWFERSLLEFDNKIFFIEWKVSEYQKQKTTSKTFCAFRDLCQSFDYLEKHYFAEQEAPL